MNLQRVLNVAVAAARDAVEIHRANLPGIEGEEWAEKGQHDFVTRVDREAEARIIERIRSAYPDHRFLSEEEATAPVAARLPGSGDPIEPAQSGGHEAVPAARLEAAKLEAGWIWVIDPLDGTTNYLHRYPMYSASVAVLEDGHLAAGVVMNGASGEIWTATRGGGAFLDGRPIHVSATVDPSRALIGTGFPFKALNLLPAYTKQFGRILEATAGVRRAGSAALDLCHLATGYFDGFWELTLAPWDVAAGALIVREAGGTVTRLDGNPDVVGSGSVLASNGGLHSWLASILLDD